MATQPLQYWDKSGSLKYIVMIYLFSSLYYSSKIISTTLGKSIGKVSRVKRVMSMSRLRVKHVMSMTRPRVKHVMSMTRPRVKHVMSMTRPRVKPATRLIQ